MKSTFLSLKVRDFIKALAMAVLGPVVAIIVSSAQNGDLTFNWHLIATVAISSAGGYLLKNLFTDDVSAAQKVIIQAKEDQAKDQPRNNIRGFCMLILLSFAFLCGNSQSFFRPLPMKGKPMVNSKFGVAQIPVSGSAPAFWAVRPIVSAVSLFVDGGVEAAAGGGISYQNISQVDGRNYVNYAFSALMLAGGSVVPNKPSDIEKFGLMISALNNTIGVGYGISNRRDIITGDKTWKGGLMVAWTVNFNN